MEIDRLDKHGLKRIRYATIVSSYYENTGFRKKIPYLFTPRAERVVSRIYQ